MTKSFISGDLRKHREGILFDREKSLLPATMPYVEIRKKLVILQQELVAQKEKVAAVKKSNEYVAYDVAFKKYQNDYYKVGLQYRIELRAAAKEKEEKVAVMREVALDTYKKNTESLRAEYKKTTLKYADILKELKKQEKDYKLISNNIRRHNRAYQSNDPDVILAQQGSEPEKERRKFIRACPADGCKGFLSQQWHCGICECWVCPDCHELKAAQEDPGHECKQENIDTAKLLAKDTRPCPNCAAQIFKIVGCDIMFCTACNTPFSWSKGTVITHGHIHNPHYFEWMRSQGTTHDRTAGDIPCGDVPVQNHFWGLITMLREMNEWKNYIVILSDIYRMIIHVRYVFLDRLPTHNLLPEDNRDYRVDYLMNKITEEQLKGFIQRAEKKREKGLALRLVYEMFVTAGCDILRGLMSDETRMMKKPEEWLAEFEGLRNYTNECLKKNAHTFNSFVEIIHLDKGRWHIENYKVPKAGPTRSKRSRASSTPSAASPQTNQFVGTAQAEPESAPHVDE